MNISTHITNKDASSYKLFRSATTKVSVGTPFQSGLKMIHRHTIIRAEMIATERSFTRDFNLYFIYVKSLAVFFFILTDFTFGTLLKWNENGL